VLPKGCRVVSSVKGCAECDDAWGVGRDIEDLGINRVELFLLCLIDSFIGLGLLEDAVAISGSVKATFGLTAREALVALGGAELAEGLEIRKGIWILSSWTFNP